MYITDRKNSLGLTLHPFNANCHYWSQRKEPTHKWPSWHNHTGSFPRFSNCPTVGLSVERYKLDMEVNKEVNKEREKYEKDKESIRGYGRSGI